MFDKTKRKAQNLKTKWDGLPKDAKRAYATVAVGGAAALYFYNVGYNWAWKCAKNCYQEELQDILRGMNLHYANILNGVSSMEELEAAGRSGAFMYEFVDFLGRKARVGLQCAFDSQGKHTA